MATVSPASTPESIALPRSMSLDASPPQFPSPDLVPDPSPSSPDGSRSTGSPYPDDASTSSPNPNRAGDFQSEVALKSEEYRQLFRLPAEEVLIQDFNCACQESILLQGHMYLFLSYICFYSNIFGFETKKVIPIKEVTCVKRAKTAGIFPNAIEINAGGKKYFFASFLSRDEAFKLIHEGWLENGAAIKAKSEAEVTEQQDSLSDYSDEVNGVIAERTESRDITNELASPIRYENSPLSSNSDAPVISQNDVPPSPNGVQQHAELVVQTLPSSSTNTLNWKIEDLVTPMASSDFTKVADTTFSISVEEFFRSFFSDEAINFVESFHKHSGDKEFSCTSWQPHEKFGHARSVSFQHPIKIYFGAKFGSCQETQKFRVYRNSLVIETSQVIQDVPYGDYFTVEGLWDVQRECSDSKEGCVLRIYVNVAFSKRTMWKGKIVQSTLEECREAYATWIDMAHELLKQKNLERQEGVGPGNATLSVGLVAESRDEDSQVQIGNECRGIIEEGNSIERTNDTSRGDERNDENEATVAPPLREPWVGLTSFVKRQGQRPHILVIAFVVILLMQVTIVVLLRRPQQVQVVVAEEYKRGGGGGEMSLGWMERRMHFLREEMLMVEAQLERMRLDHASLKAQLTSLERLLLLRRPTPTPAPTHP